MNEEKQTSTGLMRKKNYSRYCSVLFFFLLKFVLTLSEVILYCDFLELCKLKLKLKIGWSSVIAAMRLTQIHKTLL